MTMMKTNVKIFKLSFLIFVALLSMALFSKADKFNDDGWKLVKEGNYNDANKQFDEAIKVKPEHEMAVIGKNITDEIISLKKNITKSKTELALTKAEIALLKKNGSRELNDLKKELEETKKSNEENQQKLEEMTKTLQTLNRQIIEKAKDSNESRNQLVETKKKLAMAMQEYADVQSNIAKIKSSLATTTEQLKKENQIQIENLKKDYEEKLKDSSAATSELQSLMSENNSLKQQISNLVNENNELSNKLVRLSEITTRTEQSEVKLSTEKPQPQPVTQQQANVKSQIPPPETSVKTKQNEIDELFSKAINELEKLELSTLDVEKNLSK